MKPADRFEWIDRYLRENGAAKAAVDICDTMFVESYIEATNARHAVQMYGAPKCPQLGRDLAAMAKAYRLKRQHIGLEGMGGMGFPTWVWSYRIHPVWIS